MTVELVLFIKSHFTRNAHNILHLNHCTYRDVLSRTVTHFQRSRVGYEWFYRHQNCVEVASHAQLELNIAGVLSVPTDKNLKD